MSEIASGDRFDRAVPTVAGVNEHGDARVEDEIPRRLVGVQRAVALRASEAEVDDQRDLVGGDAEVLPLLVVLGIAAVARG
jgi:hypothetical protein